MAEERQKIYWIKDFMGMTQRQDWDQIPVNMSPLLVNISMDKPGSWAKRKGSDLLATTQAGNGVYGLIEYVPNSGSNAVRAVRSTDLDEYSVAGDSWSAIDAAQFTASTKVQSTNFLNRVYHINTSDYLCYESGGACTNVGAGGNEIRGNSIGVAQNTLFIGGVTYAGASQSYQDRVYYSLFNADNNTPTHQLYNTSPSETMATSTRWFTLLKPVRGLYPYIGSSGDDVMYCFTESECFQFDMRLENNAMGLRKVFDIGLANPRAITRCNDWLVWMDSSGRIWAYAGSGRPMNLSWDLEDDSNAESLMNLISASQLENVCAGSLGSKFYFSIGDISYFGESYSNTVLVGLITQNFNNVLWSLYTYPVKPVIFANATFSSQRVLLFGSDAVDDVYRIETGTNDGSTAINAKAKTMFTSLGADLMKKDIKSIWVKYRPQSADDTFLKVSYAEDNKFSYTAISDPDAGTPVTNHGKIDMYESDASTNLEQIKKVGCDPSVSCRTLSLELANAKASESFEISGIGVVYTERPYTLNYDST